MAKYIGTYASSGDVQTALDNQELSRPFIAYTTDNEDVIFGAAAEKAEAGDIVVYSTADDLLHYIKQADYSASTYPVADYVPVGVVATPQADDAILGPAGEITFMGLNWLDRNNPDVGNSGKQQVSWGYRGFDIPELTNYASSGTAITDMNGKANTEAVLNYATAQTDWRTASAITLSDEEGYYPLFECAWRYHTSGTLQGDWYVPACGQVWESVKTQTIIDAISAGYALLGRSNNDYIMGKTRFGTSTENSDNYAWSLKDGSYPNCYFTTQGKNNSLDFSTRPYCSKLMTRI